MNRHLYMVYCHKRFLLTYYLYLYFRSNDKQIEDQYIQMKSCMHKLKLSVATRADRALVDCTKGSGGIFWYSYTTTSSISNAALAVFS